MLFLISVLHVQQLLIRRYVSSIVAFFIDKLNVFSKVCMYNVRYMQYAMQAVMQLALALMHRASITVCN